MRIGTFIHPKWTLELGIEDAGATKKTIANPYTILAAASPSTFPAFPIPQTTVTTKFLTVTTTVGFHPRTSGRVRPAYFAGVALVHATYKSDYFTRILPLASTLVSAGTSLPITLPPPTTILVPTGTTDTQNRSGFALGAETAIDLGRQVSLVPEIRVLTFSVRGDGVFLIRPGVGVRWGF